MFLTYVIKVDKRDVLKSKHIHVLLFFGGFFQYSCVSVVLDFPGKLP